jgi:NAD-dependent dihydropyrimidine dehydrogenase PreA subunit
MAIKVDLNKCTGCGNCKDACPMEAISIKNGKAVIGDTCAECAACISACPNNALAL